MLVKQIIVIIDQRNDLQSQSQAVLSKVGGHFNKERQNKHSKKFSFVAWVM